MSALSRQEVRPGTKPDAREETAQRDQRADGSRGRISASSRWGCYPANCFQRGDCITPSQGGEPQFHKPREFPKRAAPQPTSQVRLAVREEFPTIPQKSHNFKLENMMRLVIDGQRLTGERTGVGRCLESLLAGWAVT